MKLAKILCFIVQPRKFGTLHKIHTPDNMPELFEAETRLYDLKQGALTITQYFNTLNRCWMQLDLHEIHSKCAEDSTMYRKIADGKRTIRFTPWSEQGPQ